MQVSRFLILYVLIGSVTYHHIPIHFIIMKPLNRKNYGSIAHLSNSKLGEGDHYIDPGQERILTETKRDRHDAILVFEKYDGSNVGVAKKGRHVFALTRSGYEATSSLQTAPRICQMGKPENDLF